MKPRRARTKTAKRAAQDARSELTRAVAGDKNGSEDDQSDQHRERTSTPRFRSAGRRRIRGGRRRAQSDGWSSGSPIWLALALTIACAARLRSTFRSNVSFLAVSRRSSSVLRPASVGACRRRARACDRWSRPAGSRCSGSRSLRARSANVGRETVRRAGRGKQRSSSSRCATPSSGSRFPASTSICRRKIWRAPSASAIT